jgi:uncharacterized protein YbjT (DUF2867 family)
MSMTWALYYQIAGEDFAMKTALIAGATGLVGGQLLRVLLEKPEYAKVTALVRRPLPLSDSRLEQRVIDFDHLEEQTDAFQVDDVFCCLGTTIKKAGSQPAFRKVDFEYPLSMAKLAKAQGARRFLLVSAMGADARSAIFYNRVKGEVEAAIAALQLPSFQVFRPSLLLGERPEVRFGERVAVALSPIISPLMPARVKPIQAADVALAMWAGAQRDPNGTEIHLNDELLRMAAETRR